MSVETRNGRQYWYDRKRVNGRVRATYYGPVPDEMAENLRLLAADRAAMRVAERELVTFAGREADGVLDAGAEFDGLADQVFRAGMMLAGYRLHKRSEWRRARGGPIMLRKIENLLGGHPEAGPAPAVIRPTATDPEQQKILDRAARGDASVIPAVEELLKNPQNVANWGAIGHLARTALITQAAGSDFAVGLAIARKVEEVERKLRADAGPNPSYAERLAATRAANAWLTVNTLEAKAGFRPPGSAEAAALDKRVTAAEKRLHAALKSLAVLRRLRGPAVVVQQLNAGNGAVVLNTGAAAGG